MDKCKYCGKFIKYPKRNNCGSQQCIRLREAEQDKRHYFDKIRPNRIVKLRDRKTRLTQKIKISIRNRDKYYKKSGICLLCEEANKTDNHHISYVPSIVIELCEKCHIKLHSDNLKLVFVRELK